MLDLLFKNAAVITMDQNRRTYTRGYVGIKDGLIECVGPMYELCQNTAAARVIDATGMALLPGLIDAHGHGGHCLIAPLGEFTSDWSGLAEEIYYRCTDNDFWYAEGALAAASRVRFGITTGLSMVGSFPRVDQFEPVGANLEGSKKVGIRQFSGMGTGVGPWPKRARAYRNDGSFDEYDAMPDMALKNTERALREYSGMGSLSTCIVAPGTMGLRPYESREDNIRHNLDMFRLSREYGVPLHTHAYSGDVAFLWETTPEILNPNLSLTHCTGLSSEEIDILAKTGTYVFHGPTTRSCIRKFVPSYDMLCRGVNLAIVTDGTAPDRSFDLWRDMKNLQLVQRSHTGDTSILPCGKVLELVTLAPAKALGIDHLVGSLEKGKQADIIAVDVNQPHLVPFDAMPVERLVYFATGGDIVMTMVQGRIVMENRHLTLCDEGRILSDANRAFERMFARLGKPGMAKNPNLYSLRS